MDKDGYVYILSNASMPGLLKIGKSRRGGRHRAKEIYQTGVPTPFHLEFEIYTPDCDALEMYVHERLYQKRVNNSREFFEIEVSQAIANVSEALLEDHEYAVIWNEFGDIECELNRMYEKSDIGETSCPHTMHMRLLLDYISADEINKAHLLYIEKCKERKARLAKARENNGQV